MTVLEDLGQHQVKRQRRIARTHKRPIELSGQIVGYEYYVYRAGGKCVIRKELL